MTRLSKRFLLAFMLAAFLMPGVNAAFKKTTFGGTINCNKPSRKGTLKFIPGAPNGNYSVLIQAALDDFSAVTIDGESLTESGFTKDFNIPDDEGGLDTTGTCATLQKSVNFEVAQTHDECTSDSGKYYKPYPK